MDYAAVHEAVKKLERIRNKDRVVDAMVLRAEGLLRGHVSSSFWANNLKLET
jgi:hypothetical protein